MKNIHNAVSDVLETYNGSLTAKVLDDPNVPCRWRIEVRHIQAPDAFLEIEMLELDGEWVGAVLQKVNIGRRSMNRFMDLLMEHLED